VEYFYPHLPKVFVQINIDEIKRDDMLFSIKRLINDQSNLITIREDISVKSALEIMLTNQFTQLPVVDENGFLRGMVTENSIMTMVYHMGTTKGLMENNVSHCQAKAETISSESNIFDALELLKRTYAIVVVEKKKPIGIVTDFDTTEYFRDVIEGLYKIQSIEVALKSYIEHIFDGGEELRQALRRAKSSSSFPSDTKELELEYLTFMQIMQVITSKGNWEYFEQYFSSKEVFNNLFHEVRRIRNILAHFRGSLSQLQYTTLDTAINWLETRPKFPSETTEPILIEKSPEHSRTNGKYKPLEEWFKELPNSHNRIRMSFDDIEMIIQDELPKSAKGYRAWWENDYTSRSQALSWLKAGWLVRTVQMESQEVSFRRSKYPLMQLFFADLLERLKDARPDATKATKTGLKQNWWAFSAGKSGVLYSWVFAGDGTFRNELYIDTGDQVKNKQMFDTLYSQKESIESESKYPIYWERLNERRASRIYSAYIEPTNVLSPLDQQEKAKEWGMESMISYIDIFKDRLTKI
jgi:predicted transcriptional regulator